MCEDFLKKDVSQSFEIILILERCLETTPYSSNAYASSCKLRMCFENFAADFG